MYLRCPVFQWRYKYKPNPTQAVGIWPDIITKPSILQSHHTSLTKPSPTPVRHSHVEACRKQRRRRLLHLRLSSDLQRHRTLRPPNLPPLRHQTASTVLPPELPPLPDRDRICHLLRRPVKTVRGLHAGGDRQDGRESGDQVRF